MSRVIGRAIRPRTRPNATSCRNSFGRRSRGLRSTSPTRQHTAQARSVCASARSTCLPKQKSSKSARRTRFRQAWRPERPIGRHRFRIESDRVSTRANRRRQRQPTEASSCRRRPKRRTRTPEEVDDRAFRAATISPPSPEFRRLPRGSSFRLRSSLRCQSKLGWKRNVHRLSVRRRSAMRRARRERAQESPMPPLRSSCKKLRGCVVHPRRCLAACAKPSSTRCRSAQRPRRHRASPRQKALHVAQRLVRLPRTDILRARAIAGAIVLLHARTHDGRRERARRARTSKPRISRCRQKHAMRQK